MNDVVRTVEAYESAADACTEKYRSQSTADPARRPRREAWAVIDRPNSRPGVASLTQPRSGIVAFE